MDFFVQSAEIAVIWGSAIPFLASFISVALVSGLSTFPMRRLTPGTHWSEVARSYSPVRLARNYALIWIAMQAYFSGGNGDTGFKIFLLWIATCSALAGCVAGFRLSDLGLHMPPCSRPRRLGSLLTRGLLFPSFPSMIAIIALTLKQGLDWESYMIAGAIVLLNVVLITGGSIKILKWVGALRPADMPLQQQARDLAAVRGVPLQSVLRMDLGAANAFASIWTRELIVTDTAIAALDPNELHAVIAHEIGHLAESSATRWKRMAGLPGMAAIGLAPAALVGGKLLIAAGMFAAFYLLNRWVARNYKKLEIEADRLGHVSESAEGVYARALEKIHAANLIPAVFSPRHHYPNLYDRMTGAGVVPDFPRPAPPNRILPILIGALAAVIFFFTREGLDRVAHDWWTRHQGPVGLTPSRTGSDEFPG